MNTIDLIKTKAIFEEVSHSGYYDVAMLRLCMDLTINIQGTRRENETRCRHDR